MVVTLDQGGFDIAIACLILAVLVGNMVLARRHHR